MVLDVWICLQITDLRIGDSISPDMSPRLHGSASAEFWVYGNSPLHASSVAYMPK
jgi:hypothetical protein